jgi:hypothetical protein
MRTTHRLLVLACIVAAGCSSGGPSPASSRSGAPRASDSRVKPLRGQPPPEFTSDVRWLDTPPTTLAALRGKVVFVQFAFPT